MTLLVFRSSLKTRDPTWLEGNVCGWQTKRENSFHIMIVFQVMGLSLWNCIIQTAMILFPVTLDENKLCNVRRVEVISCSFRLQPEAWNKFNFGFSRNKIKVKQFLMSCLLSFCAVETETLQRHTGLSAFDLYPWDHQFLSVGTHSFIKVNKNTGRFTLTRSLCAQN